MGSLNRSKNISYQTDGIAKFFADHRDKWEDFYLSEKWAFEKLANSGGGFGKVLDAGCASGGLGLALSRRFRLKEYIGVDINPPAIEEANSRSGEFSLPVKFECKDILEVNSFKPESFDTVISLSCADWNIETEDIINKCWSFLRPGGNFIISVRLTPEPGINDMNKSYQPISLDSQGKIIEAANYVVFNVFEFFRLIKNLKPKPDSFYGYGYWGKPAVNAVTPYERLVFAVFIINKSKAETVNINSELLLPLDLFTS